MTKRRTSTSNKEDRNQWRGRRCIDLASITPRTHQAFEANGDKQKQENCLLLTRPNRIRNFLPESDHADSVSVFASLDRHRHASSCFLKTPFKSTWLLVLHANTTLNTILPLSSPPPSPSSQTQDIQPQPPDTQTGKTRHEETVKRHVITLFSFDGASRATRNETIYRCWVWRNTAAKRGNAVLG